MVFEADKDDWMQLVWTTLSIGRENVSNLFQCEIQTSKQNKTVKGGDDKIKTVTSDTTQQNKS